MELGYIRVSSRDQNTARQLQELNLPLENLYIDRCSGKNADRPELINLLRAVRPGDTVHVHSLDRLARNLRDLQDIVDQFQKKKCTLYIHKENLIFRGSADATTRLIMQIFGSLAEWERSLIHERQAEGIAAAKEQGRHLGRPKTYTEEQKEHALEFMRRDIETPLARISRETGIPRTTLREIRREFMKSADAEKQENADPS